MLPELKDVILDIEKKEEKTPTLVVTSSKIRRTTISYKKLNKIDANNLSPLLLLFGTGWGLCDEIIKQADYQVEPIMKNSDFNHLSVRSAIAIVLDRLLGE